MNMIRLAVRYPISFLTRNRVQSMIRRACVDRSATDYVVSRLIRPWHLGLSINLRNGKTGDGSK